MEVDLSRLPTGTAGWHALVNHALALGDLAEIDYLELKGKLSFAVKADRKRSAVIIARAVLGMANRMPAVAARHLGGYGVVLVGMERGQVVVAERVDGAVLHDALEPYLGTDGPGWDYLFLNHPRGLVMAVVVNPPQWGDRIHTCRKEYSAEDGGLSVRDGEVFVRVPGKTRPATSSDLSDLERRRDRSRHTGAQVTVEYSGQFHRVDSSSVVDMISQMVEETADSLLVDVRSGSTYPYVGTLASLTQEDRRSPDKFRSDVEEWREKANERIAEITREFLRHELARDRWTISVDSDLYLESVRAQIDFPPSVMVLMASDTEYCDHGGPFDPRSLLPSPPPRWGSLKAFDLHYQPPRFAPMSAIRRPEFEVDETPHGTQVTWHLGDLRPRSVERGEELFAVVTDDHLQEIDLRWRITARGVDHVFEGQSRIACAEEPGDHLGWRRTPPNGEGDSE